MGDSDHPFAPGSGPPLGCQLFARIQGKATATRRWGMPDIAARPHAAETPDIPLQRMAEKQSATFLGSCAANRVLENRETLMIHPQQRWREGLLTDTLCARC